jgi:SEC-C motif-containing protein
MVMQKKSVSHHDEPCLCGSGHVFLECCRPYISLEEPVPTAKALMRSRYSAYVLSDEEYLLSTWHDSTRPVQLNLNTDESPFWLGLRILSCEKGAVEDEEGSVEFVANYQVNGVHQQLQEKSRFVKEHGQWFYLDGEIKETSTKSQGKSKPGRNEPCPCGSGKKYKRCCGRG